MNYIGKKEIFLNWDLKGDGIVLSKVHDASGYQVEEE
jgi:hypothetical protein